MLDEFRKDASAQGFTGSVHIQVGAQDEFAEAEWVQSIADANPDWPIAQVVFCDLTAVDVGAQLDRFQALLSVRAARQIVGRAPREDKATGTNELLDNERFVTGLQELGRRGLSFDLQLIPELLQKTARVLQQAPDTKVALCHAGSPHDRSQKGLKEWARVLRALSDLPNVCCKLSGLGMFQHCWTTNEFRPIIETCMEQFGPNRCMFGSNFPVDSFYSDYARLVDAYRDIVPKSMHAQFFHSTAARHYNI